MSNQLKQFNLIYEELLLESRRQSFFKSFSKNWTFEDQLEAILPFILKKCQLAITNFYEVGKPGEPQIINLPTIEPIDQGTQNPGFKITYDLSNEYVKNNLLPCLISDKRSRVYKLYKKYGFTSDETKLVLVLNATLNKNFDLDLAKITKNKTKIPKFSIGNWDGKLYLNFKCPDVDRQKSNIQIRND